MIVIAVALGGFIGASLRYIIDQMVRARTTSRFPFGTLTVNVIGSLLLGLILGAQLENEILPFLLGTGICGALTTFSTFSVETFILIEKEPKLAFANVFSQLVCGLAAAGVGLWLASSLG